MAKNSDKNNIEEEIIEKEELLDLDIEKEEDLDEKVLENAKEAYEKRIKIPFDMQKKIGLKILKELIIPVIMCILFAITYVLKDVLNFITINIFVVILGTLSIAVYELSYRRSKEEYFIKGLEINVLTYVYIVFSNTLIQARLDKKSMFVYALVIFRILYYKKYNNLWY